VLDQRACCDCRQCGRGAFGIRANLTRELESPDELSIDHHFCTHPDGARDDFVYDAYPNLEAS
jgi:hypothetical protein